jgi:hypothetical protein
MNPIKDSIPSKCKLYKPDLTKPIHANCEKLGILYECKNNTIPDNIFCLGCKHIKDIKFK